MSGGTDSSFAAYLLKKRGYAVTGITMRVDEDTSQIAKAKRVAEGIGIPHLVRDVRREFNLRVIDYFCRQYIKGYTPNPCLACNRFIKFGLLFNTATEQYDYFATGHYARVVYETRRKIYCLVKGKDKKKDQSYVLYMLTQKQLSRLLLPLGNYTKQTVRQRVKQLRLPVDTESESQDICFVRDEDYTSFIRKFRPDFKIACGNIKNIRGEILGEHKGYLNYTIGQRKGLGIAYKTPLYVAGIDAKKNEVVVGEEKDLFKRVFTVTDISFTAPRDIKQKFCAQVKIRYHHQPAKAQIRKVDKNSWQVEFFKPQKAITPGQAAVFYKNERVFGGGIINRVESRF
ncbi:MAG: tRNA 2-thiouridine(34) synthase MnmA [Candidatus Omnitrophica bacterium]|nr:tRNA 2-thiouridine(34) synthase MnmA [Candidatus Omnitrophota bacterium]MBU1925524.1 tRNA 2-thiouridine(34) synthase MnmA [Candidatus Omnitrophota bacterium]